MGLVFYFWKMLWNVLSVEKGNNEKVINGEEIDSIIRDWAIKCAYYVHFHDWHQLHSLPSYHYGLNFERFNQSGDDFEQKHLCICFYVLQTNYMYPFIHSFVQQISFSHLPSARKWIPLWIRQDPSSKIKSSKVGENINKSGNVKIGW